MNDEVRRSVLTKWLVDRLLELSERCPGTYRIVDPLGRDVLHVTLNQSAGLTWIDPPLPEVQP